MKTQEQSFKVRDAITVTITGAREDDPIGLPESVTGVVTRIEGREVTIDLGDGSTLDFHTGEGCTVEVLTPQPWLIEQGNPVKPVVPLVGMDGNAFSIIGRVTRAWRQMGRPDMAEEFRARATSGDYNHLLAVAMEYVDEEAAWGEEEEDTSWFIQEREEDDEAPGLGYIE